MPDAEEYHMHNQHIANHNLFRISPEARKLKRDEPEKYKLFSEAIDAHIKQHEKFLQGKSQGNVYDNAKAALQGTAKKPRS